MANATAIADAFIDAYNAGDDDELLMLCAEDIQVVHHNRELNLTGREAFGNMLDLVSMLFPDKRFGPRRVIHADDERAVIVHTWTGTAEAPVPGLATKAGDAVSVDICSIYTVRDGLVVGYHDYG